MDDCIFQLRDIWISLFHHLNSMSRGNTHRPCANSVDSDKTPRFVASGLCLQYLPMPYLWDAKNQVVNIFYECSVWTVFLNDMLLVS